MPTIEEYALAVEMSDRLLELYSKRDDALDEGDTERLAEVQEEIENVRCQRIQILRR